MMRRLTGWIIAVALLVAAAVWLADSPGSVSLEWQGWRVDTSVAFLLGCVAVVAIAAAILWRGLGAVWRLPRRFLLFRRTARREKGYRALTQGLVAVAAGDAAEAARLARRADELLGEPPVTLLLSAQAAQLAGDEEAARRYFNSMLEQPETAFLALRGLMVEAERAGDEDAALDYARRAYRLRPKTPWVARTLFALQVKRGLWREALATVEAGLRHGIFAGEDGRRRQVVALLACSGAAGDAGEARDALGFARRAHELAPEFLPAVLREAGLLVGSGRAGRAQRLIEDAWATRPHPELARLYLSIYAGEEPIARMRRVERLASHNAGHRESHLALAAAAIEAKLWGTARSHLEQAEAAGGLDARLCRLRADVEEAEHGDVEAVRRWLMAAADAAPDPAWVCDGCGAAWRHWSPVCGRCEAFATLSWSVPERARELVAYSGRAGPAGEALPAARPPGDGGPPGAVLAEDAAFTERAGARPGEGVVVEPPPEERGPGQAEAPPPPAPRP